MARWLVAALVVLGLLVGNVGRAEAAVEEFSLESGELLVLDLKSTVRIYSSGEIRFFHADAVTGRVVSAGSGWGSSHTFKPSSIPGTLFVFIPGEAQTVMVSGDDWERVMDHDFVHYWHAGDEVTIRNEGDEVGYVYIGSSNSVQCYDWEDVRQSCSRDGSSSSVYVLRPGWRMVVSGEGPVFFKQGFFLPPPPPPGPVERVTQIVEAGGRSLQNLLAATIRDWGSWIGLFVGLMLLLAVLGPLLRRFVRL